MKMAESLDMRNIVKHLANGTISELCLVCLSPLIENAFESIFTLICKEEKVYCVADALMAICQFEFQGIENYNICIDCFKSTSAAYKVHLQAKQSMEIITHYTEELINNIKNVEVTNDDMEKLLCIPLSEYVPQTCLFDFNLDGIGGEVTEMSDEESTDNLIVMADNENASVLNLDSDGKMNLMKPESDDGDDDEEMVVIINEKKLRKKRDPMVSMTCSRCPIKYRFVAKLKEHMKSVHSVDIYYCKLCKILSEDKEEYEEHLKSHRGKHQCSVCHTVYKKAETLLAHMTTHEEDKEFEQSENANICELCGTILEDEASLQDHITSKHVKKYTCYYCGRMYKGEASFESHIQKHEEYWKKKSGTKTDESASKQSDKKADKRNKSKRSVCQTCGKDFVDERSLLWHQRLHNNDRPYTCEVCGRSFVTVNRRNQHAVCAHTRPARRCPLCPALFHLRSMVNTHVKKVHLKAHKRRMRKTKHQNVFWRTEAVPIQELSVDVQNDILELQTAQAEEAMVDEAPSPISLIYLNGIPETSPTIEEIGEDL